MFGLGKKKFKGEAAKERRNELLSAPASEVAPEGVDTSEVWLAAIEIVKPEATITYFSMANGDTSVFYSSGRGHEGLEKGENVTEASRKFVHETAEFLSELEVTDELGEPITGNVTFWARKGEDTYYASYLEDIVAVGGHPLSRLYAVSQDVVKHTHAVLSR